MIPHLDTLDYHQRGELLACLSTYGLMEYVHHPFELEHDYLAGLVEQLNDRLNLIRDFQAKLQKIAEDKERRARLVSSMEEQAIGSMKGALTLTANSVKRPTSGLMGGGAPAPPAAKIQRLTGTFGNGRRSLFVTQGGGQALRESSLKAELEVAYSSGRHGVISGQISGQPIR